MSDKTNLIKSKIDELNEKIKSSNAYVLSIEEAIKKLKIDRGTTLNNIHIINGAIQAYQDTLNVLNENVTEVINQNS